MIERLFGTTGNSVARIGQGTWNLEHVGRREAMTALQAGIDAGLTHIDTAEMYGDGRVEEIVGEAVRGRRDAVYLVSKVLPWNASAAGTVQACEASLRRLRVSALDAYLLHWPGSHPLAETLEAFENLRNQGKIRAYGVSNFHADALEEAVRLAGPGRVACNQVLYHMRERTIEHFVLPACERHGVALVAYSPFGSGDFPGVHTSGGACLAAIAAKHGRTTHQVALAFLSRSDSVFAIPKAVRLEHVHDNAGSGDLVLSKEDVRALEEAFPLPPERRDIPMI